MKVQIDIFSGFLGAGKTMLIKKLLNEKAYEKDTVIIENEFGEVSIDGEVLKESSIEIKEINSGCICCQVSGDFGNAVLEVINKYDPSNIIIEPSGVAKLSEILNILNEKEIKNKTEIRNIITLIDIRNYDRYISNFKEFYENQIRNADKIILSRSQLVDDKIIDKTINSLQKLNSKAEIICKSWNKIKTQEILKANSDNRKKEVAFTKSKVKNILMRENTNYDAKDVFESYPINIIECISIKEIEKKFEFIANSKSFGNVIRAKGILKDVNGEYYQFDYVPNEFRSRKIMWSNKKVVSIIGSKLNRKELLELFK